MGILLLIITAVVCFVFFFGFILFISWLGVARHYYFCHIKGTCVVVGGSQHPILATKIPYTLCLMSNDSIVLEDYPEFYFDFGSHQAVFMESHLQLKKKQQHTYIKSK